MKSTRGTGERRWRVVYTAPGGEAMEWVAPSLELCKAIITRYGDQMQSYAIQRLKAGAWTYWLGE